MWPYFDYVRSLGQDGKPAIVSTILVIMRFPYHYPSVLMSAGMAKGNKGLRRALLQFPALRCLVGWLADWLIYWLVDWLIGWLTGVFVGWLVVRFVSWLVGWYDGWFIVDRLAGLLVGCSRSVSSSDRVWGLWDSGVVLCEQGKPSDILRADPFSRVFESSALRRKSSLDM